MSDLDDLRRQVQRALRRNLAEAAPAHPALVARLNAVEQAFTPLRGHRSLPRIAKGVLAFRLAGRKAAYPDIKYACYAVARPVDWEGRIILAETGLLDQLLAAVTALLARRRWFRECYRGLLTAWVTDIVAPDEGFDPDYWQEGRSKLETFLLAHREQLAPAKGQEAWITTLEASGLDDPAALRRDLGMAG